jgi:cell wall-associated NlpC family hydrolase
MTAASEIPSETPAARPIPSLPIFTPPTETNVEALPSVNETPSPGPSAQKTPTATATPAATPATTATPAATATPATTATPNALSEIAESANYPAALRKVVDLAQQLTARRLSYKYVSADPKSGGMDSSGFIYYVLTQSGVKGVPRDAREQYIWVRKAGNFQAVLAQRDDTFELDNLKPGDLLFWSSNYGTSRDPDITQTMIYLGRDKATNQRLMVGASESGVYKNQRRAGVSIFDFKVGRAPAKSQSEESVPVFVGYGHIPGLPEK